MSTLIHQRWPKTKWSSHQNWCLLNVLGFFIGKEKWQPHELEICTSSNTVVKKYDKIHQKFSVIKTNKSDDIKKIVNFGILFHILSWRQKETQVFVMITENFWRNFWRTFWRPLFDAVQNSSFNFSCLKLHNPVDFDTFLPPPGYVARGYIITCGLIWRRVIHFQYSGDQSQSIKVLHWAVFIKQNLRDESCVDLGRFSSLESMIFCTFLKLHILSSI